MGHAQAPGGPAAGPVPVVAAAALHPTFEPQNPARQTARAQVTQLKSYLQQVVVSIQTASDAVPSILLRASTDEMLAKEMAREEVDVAMVNDFLRMGRALLQSVSQPTTPEADA